MMIDPITPPLELVHQWVDMLASRSDQAVFTMAAQWGADQELLACGNYLEKCAAWEPEDVTEFYNYRRPQPPSLKEQALEALDRMDQLPTAEDQRIIRRALEALDD